jgi:hypothetical protein
MIYYAELRNWGEDAVLSEQCNKYSNNIAKSDEMGEDKQD